MTTFSDMGTSEANARCSTPWLRILVLGALCAATPLPFSAGCRRAATQPEDAGGPAAEANLETRPPAADVEPMAFEAGADELLAARLPADQAADGWIQLFDGHTLFGWDIAGAANWRVEDNRIVADAGEQSLLCTSVPWQDYELTLEFKADAQTNSGVFLRTPLEPTDPASDCYEVNIAPLDHPFPAGSVVGRQKANPPEPPLGADRWQTMHIKLDGGRLDVSINGEAVSQYVDENPLPSGRIGLQHNSGRIEFRNLRLRPSGLASLLDEELSSWKRYPEMPGEFSVTEEGWLHVQGGRTQLESKESYADFVLLAEYKLPTAEMNSGIFFRCIPGEEMMGYECQLSNATIDDNPLSPADCGSGGFFRRQDARIVAGEVDQWATVLLVVHGRSMAAWVNGLQVSNWYDDRQSDENPRRGLRLEAGTIMIQGHDPETDAWLRQIKIKSTH